MEFRYEKGVAYPVTQRDKSQKRSTRGRKKSVQEAIKIGKIDGNDINTLTFTENIQARKLAPRTRQEI